MKGRKGGESRKGGMQEKRDSGLEGLSVLRRFAYSQAENKTNISTGFKTGGRDM